MCYKTKLGVTCKNLSFFLFDLLFVFQNDLSFLFKYVESEINGPIMKRKCELSTTFGFEDKLGNESQI